MFQTVLEKGISSWIEFGMNIKGMRAARGKDMDIASIVKQSILKARFKKQRVFSGSMRRRLGGLLCKLCQRICARHGKVVTFAWAFPQPRC